ncbi:MAG: dTMP kinase [Candidatus Aminicenantes bacterium]|jgi:dTMP kinase
MVKLKRGVLIVFEGIDGAGKSTQAEILLKKLRELDYPVVYYCEPSDSKWGREIKRKAQYADSLTPQEELELFQRDREENVRAHLKPSLEKKEVIILDRYYFSTMAYQGAKGVDPESIRERNEAFAVKPDLVFILDVEPDRGLERIADRGQKDLLFEREDYLAKVRQIFKSLQEDFIYHIDATQSIEHMAEQIEEITINLLQSIILKRGTIVK